MNPPVDFPLRYYNTDFLISQLLYNVNICLIKKTDHDYAQVQ